SSAHPFPAGDPATPQRTALWADVDFVFALRAEPLFPACADPAGLAPRGEERLRRDRDDLPKVAVRPARSIRAASCPPVLAGLHPFGAALLEPVGCRRDAARPTALTNHHWLSCRRSPLGRGSGAGRVCPVPPVTTARRIEPMNDTTTTLGSAAALLTDGQRARMLAKGRENAARIDADGDTHDFWPVVKLFCPWGAATWLLSELDPDEPDIAFGLCDLGMGSPELGSVRLSEIAAIRGP
ncbi:unnamed protein product, partial [Symbiodinium sp. CCMP2456]